MTPVPKTADEALKEAVAKLTMCEEVLFSRCELEKTRGEELGLSHGDVILDIVYEKIVAARSLISNVRDGDYDHSEKDVG